MTFLTTKLSCLIAGNPSLENPCLSQGTWAFQHCLVKGLAGVWVMGKSRFRCPDFEHIGSRFSFIIDGSSQHLLISSPGQNICGA